MPKLTTAGRSLVHAFVSTIADRISILFCLETIDFAGMRADKIFYAYSETRQVSLIYSIVFWHQLGRSFPIPIFDIVPKYALNVELYFSLSLWRKISTSFSANADL